MNDTPNTAAGTAPKPEHRIRPTLYIGVGGTGKEIMLRIRRRILQTLWNGKRIEDLDAFPVVDFLYFDTFTGKAEETKRHDGEGSAIDPIQKLVELPSSSCIQKKLDINKYLQGREIERYPHIGAWLPRGELQAIRAEDGAGQVRPVSRLLFFDEVKSIRDSITAKCRQLLVNFGNQRLNELGLEVEREVQIVILTSLAGGTGSGSFLDMGFLCKSLQNPKPGNVVLYAIAGGAFSGLNERVLANTYAAMMELEYCMSSAAQMPYVESWSDHIRCEGVKHPFDDVYLFDSTNIAHQRTSNRDYLYSMIGDQLFEELHDPSLRGKRREDLVNQKQYKLEPFSPPMPASMPRHSMAFSRAYSSSGQVILDTSGRLDFEREVSGTALEMMAAFFGLAEEGKENTPQASDIDTFVVAHLMMDSVRAFDSFPEHLRNEKPHIPDYPLVDKLLFNQSESIVQHLRDRIRSVFDSIPNNTSDPKNWPDRVNEIYAEQLKMISASASDAAQYPPLIQAVRTQRRNVIDQLLSNEGIRKVLYAYLDNVERGGLTFTLRLIQMLRDRIHAEGSGLMSQLRGAQSTYEGLAKLVSEKRYTQALNNLKKAVKGGLFGGVDEKEARKALDQLSQDLQYFLEYRLRAAACAEAIEVLREVDNAFGQGAAGDGAFGVNSGSGLIREIEEGRFAVKAAIEVLQQEIRVLSDAAQSNNPFREFIDSARLPPLDVARDDFINWGRDALSRWGGSRVLFNQLRDDKGRAQILNTLRGIARERLVRYEKSLPKVAEALESLDDVNRKRLLGKALYAALPWINADFERMDGAFEPKMLSIFISVEDAENFRARFKDEILASLPPAFQGKDIFFVPSSVRGRLVIYTEMSGIALNALESLHDDWRTAYQARIQGDTNRLPLHNHRAIDRFSHPTAMKLEKMEELNQTLQLFFKGIGLGLLRRKADGRYEMNFSTTGIADWQAIGSERQLYLTGFHPPQREFLRTSIERRLQELTPWGYALLAAQLLYLAHYSYGMRKVQLPGGQEERWPGMAHIAAAQASVFFRNLFINTEEAKQMDLASETKGQEMVENILRHSAEWGVDIAGSLADTTGLEANMSPEDPAELRARDKRIVVWDKVSDALIKQWAEIQPAPMPAAPVAPQSPGLAGLQPAVPPPLPNLVFHVAINGTPSGPYSSAQLSQMRMMGDLKPDTLVWSPGMAGWTPAREVPALAGLFAVSAEPPPLPV